ncbi:MAG: WXG100 family type VII secretion target [Eubacterium sp.]|nr:WXG100 family type VII secretion target [Eubacterium sp.]
MSIFSKDIVLDEGAFDTAVSDFEALGAQIQQLRNDVDGMMNDLRAGWKTPAGQKFISSCEYNLYRPLDDQKLVIDHIAKSLKESRQAYESVFSKYDELQKTISKAKQNQ